MLSLQASSTTNICDISMTPCFTNDTIALSSCAIGSLQDGIMTLNRIGHPCNLCFSSKNSCLSIRGTLSRANCHCISTSKIAKNLLNPFHKGRNPFLTGRFVECDCFIVGQWTSNSGTGKNSCDEFPRVPESV